MYEHGDKVGATDAFLTAVVGPDYRQFIAKFLPPGAFEMAVADLDTFFQIEIPALQQWRFTAEEAKGLRQPVLAVTGTEWHRMIVEKGLTISTNLFGTTYYSLVGLHAFHVIAGLVLLAIGMIFALFGKVKPEHGERAEVFSLYWHFVDAVWVVVFTVVYVIGR